MTTSPYALALLAATLFSLSGPGLAESIASSASSAGSESVGSLSDSVGRSSDSATGGRVAAGEYRVVAVAQATDDRQRLQLQAVDDATRSFDLLLPLQVAVLQVGEHIRVLDRPYGLAFARAREADPFFVALDDTWRGDLGLRPVTL